MIFTHGIQKEHGIAWILRCGKLEAYLRKKHLLHPHNSRRHSLIRRPALEELNYQLNKYLVFESNEFPFEIPNAVLNTAFEELPRLLKAFPEAQSFTVKN